MFLGSYLMAVEVGWLHIFRQVYTHFERVVLKITGGDEESRLPNLFIRIYSLAR